MKVLISMASPYVNDKDTGFHDTLADDSTNRQTARSIMSIGKELDILGVPFVLAEKNFGKTLVFVRIYEGKIIFASVLKRGFHNKPFFEQELIWTGKEKIERGFARKFMEYIVLEYGAIQTSSKQRTMGMEMWKKFVESSIGKFHVYVGGKNVELSKIRSIDALHEKADTIWGANPVVHADQFIRVCKDPL